MHEQHEMAVLKQYAETSIDVGDVGDVSIIVSALLQGADMHVRTWCKFDTDV